LEALRQTNLSWKAASEIMKRRLTALEIEPVEDSTGEGLLDYPDHLRTYFSEMALHQERCIRRALGTQTLKEIVTTAIALKRYELRHGHYPSRLAELVPAFLPRLSIDFMDGQPLRYRVHSNEVYVLYSVGADGIDGGGLPQKSQAKPRAWNLEADWVWPQPATPAEVEQYEANEAAKFARPPLWKSRKGSQEK
jgi:hypothetical protein